MKKGNNGREVRQVKKGTIWKILCVVSVFMFLLIKCRRAGERREE